MNGTQSIFRRRKAVFSALEPFGFERAGADYVFMKKLPGSGFEMTVTVTSAGEVSAAVVDPGLREPYTLHLTDGAAGSFVGGIKTEYEALLTEISEKCFAPDVFKSAQAKELIAYARETYGDELEFLWEKFPDNAIWRRKDQQKWYGALLTVSKRKLGLKADDMVEIVDLRADAHALAELIDNERYFPGWHMNKKSWYTVILDASVPTDELCKRMDASFSLAVR